MEEKIQHAIELLREHEPEGGYALAFSGGKDSVVIKQLAIESGVKFRAFYSVTTIDYPDVVDFIRTQHKDVEWLRNPKGGFFKRLIERGFFPTRLARWCCEEFKENSLKGYGAKIIGVRAAESARRAKLWKEVVIDWNNENVKFICPIVDWSQDDVWNFIKSRNLPYCKLYDEGYTRIGCLNCPMQSAKVRTQEMKKYPNYEKAFLKAADTMWEKWHDKTKRNGEPHSASKFKNGREWYQWWISQKNMNQWLKENCQGELMFIGTNDD